MSFIVAIDGPAGSGKGTVTKILSKKTGLINIDTGAMYRCVTLECINKGITPDEENKIKQVLENIEIKFVYDNEIQKVFLNGKDVSHDIRLPVIVKDISAISALKVVRDKMTALQREMGKNQDIIMEGRDIGTVVFPEADVKIFLDCSIEETANRRYKQNLSQGINESYEEVLASIKRRQELDSNREIAPLKKADDAILIDSTNMTIEEVVEEIEKIINERKLKND